MRHPAEGKEVLRSLRLGQEVDIAVGLLEQGLATVQGDIGRAGSMDHLQLVFLSTGFERLLKCVLSYYIRETHGRFPRGGEIRKTHDVESLLDEVLDQIFTTEYRSRPSAQADYEFLRHDHRWRTLIRILKQFAEPLGRYWNLNVAMGAEVTTTSPEDLWHAAEMDVMDEQGLGQELASLREDDVSGINAVFDLLTKAMVAILERGVRALCTLFVTGALGYEGTTVEPTVSVFVQLRDEDLGIRRYSKQRPQT